MNPSRCIGTLAAVILAVVGLPPLLTAAESPAAADSALFREFATSPHRGEGTVLPDFSYAGYHTCEQPLPVVDGKTRRFFNVCDFGAVPNDGTSDHDAVVKAIEAAEKSPGPAVVFFPPGRYLLNEAGDVGKPGIVVRRSDIVLKGAGMADSELFFSEPCRTQRSLLAFRDPTLASLTEERARNDYSIRGIHLTAVNTFPPRGSYTLGVEHPEKLRVGMVVTINATIDFTSEGGKRYFAPHAVPEGALKMGKTRYLFEVHRVAGISGKVVRFAEPIQYDLPNYSSAIIYETKVIQEVGLEDLTLCGNNRELFYHHAGSRREAGFVLLTFDDVINGWVRNVRFRNYGNAVVVSRGGFNTFLNLLFEGNAGHLLAGAYAGSYGNLFLANREQTATWHGPIGNGGADTVALRSRYFANMEMHCGGARSSLLDLCQGAFAEKRGGGARNYPHQGEFNCFWNWDNTAPGKMDFWPTGSPYGYMMPPIVVGLHDQPCEITDAENDTLATEHLGAKVNPESLFEAQLALRLGSLPAWMAQEAKLFHSISNFSSLTITAPVNASEFPAQRPFTLTVEPDPRLPKDAIRTIRLSGSSTSLDDGYRVLKEFPHGSFSTTLSLPAGTWSLVATMINSRGEPCDSRRVVISVANDPHWKPSNIARSASYEETDALKNAAIALGLHVDGRSNLQQQVKAAHPDLTEPGWDKHFDAASVAAYEAGIALMTAEHAAGDNPTMAAMLIDGDRTTPIRRRVPYKYSLLLERAETTPVSRLDLDFSEDFKAGDYKIELMGSDDPRAWNTFLNDEGFWESGLIRHGESRIGYPASTSGKRLTFFFPERSYRYLRLVLPAVNLGRLSEVTVSGR